MLDPNTVECTVSRLSGRVGDALVTSVAGDTEKRGAHTS